MQEGRQEEATKIFLLLLESKFGVVNQQLQEKVRNASPELIETWAKQIFRLQLQKIYWIVDSGIVPTLQRGNAGSDAPAS
ncbi:DUF4351 domain-containing protein [Methylobacter psychrophilus]|uniref:DUF4351 domain-containing protein n=1 Tax=Methylobacter psychrophilus TaxID=96941 RepID=UPI00374E0772